MSETPPTEAICLEFALTYDDWQNARRTWRSDFQVWFRIIGLCSVLIVGPVAFLSYSYWKNLPPGAQQQPLYLKIFPVALVCGIVIAQLFFRFGMKRRNWNKENPHPEQSITLCDDGVFAQTHNQEISKSWDDYACFNESDTVFVLFFLERGYQILPKRIMTDEQVDDIRELLEYYLAPAQN